jgi:hypothetical protein
LWLVGAGVNSKRAHNPKVAGSNAGAGGPGDRVVDRRRFILTSLAGAVADSSPALRDRAGNVTGSSNLNPELVGKRLELLNLTTRAHIDSGSRQSPLA